MTQSALQSQPASDAVATAERLLTEALAEAYPNGAPEGVVELLRMQEKSGRVCAFFYNGRSGSYFAQSFFDNETHPQVISVLPAALENFENAFPSPLLERFNQGAPSPKVDSFVEDLLRAFPYFCEKLDKQPALNSLIAPKLLFRKLLHAQLLLLTPGRLNYHEVLKILFLAYRLARGGQLTCSDKLIYLWQAHQPGIDRRKWIMEHFPNSLLLTVVRFPEKSLDSHLMHHGFESITNKPRYMLMRYLFFWQMAINTEQVGDDGEREKIIRFEDLHHHTAFVLEKLCHWWGVDFDPALAAHAGAMTVRGKKISGTRKLKPSEFQCKLLNYYDRLKIRALMREEYRQWGYDTLCEPDLERSLAEYESDPIARQVPFSPIGTLGQLDNLPPSELISVRQEPSMLNQIEKAQRDKRDQGMRLMPLLYDLQALPAREKSSV